MEKIITILFFITAIGCSVHSCQEIDMETGKIVDVETHQEYLAIPNVVYENIVLRLEDGYSEYDVVDYYNNHRAWADSLTIEDKLTSW